MSGNITFEKFHYVIQKVMGWQNCHSYEFHVSGCIVGEPDEEGLPQTGGFFDARKTSLLKFFNREGKRFFYVYDFGNNWGHELVLEKITKEEIKKTLCLDGANCCPFENIGGVHVYQEFLAGYLDKDHVDHDKYLEWVDKDFNPEHFDVDEVNKGLD